MVSSPNGFVIFDDMVLDKAESQKIELVRQQWSGNAKQVIRGIGVVTCVYVNPETDQFWIIDYRILRPKRTRRASWTICVRCWRMRFIRSACRFGWS